MMDASSPLVRSPPRTPAVQPSLLTPLPHETKTPGSASSINTARIQQSPLKVAASLIQSLDVAHTEMTSFAADAALDAERARENARKAQEIARRYQNRIYPSFQLESFVAKSRDTSATQTSPFVGASRPKRPEMRRFHTTLTPRTKFTITGSTTQTVEEKDNRSKNDQGDDGNTKNMNGDAGGNSVEGTVKSGVSPSSPTPYAPGKSLSAPLSPSPNTYKRKMAPQSPTSFERLAQHHADDLLQLSMELEQTKQALKSEQRSHKECQSALEAMKAKKMKADRTNQKLMIKFGKEREEWTTRTSELEQELQVSLHKVQAAEEDAELALDIARASAEKKDEIEVLLMESRKEIDMLRARQDGKPLPPMTTPKRSVHFADADTNSVTDSSTTFTPAPPKETETPPFFTPRENGPSRAMIAAGRQILLRRQMTPQDAVLRLEVSPAKSAERRQQLCQRLSEHLNEGSNEDSSLARLSSSPSRTPLSPMPGRNATAAIEDASGALVTNKKLEEYNTAMKIMQSSGKRLELDGYWFRDENNKAVSSNSTPVQIDIIARQYCQNVEFKINRQQKDLEQLESLCGYLEKKLVLGGE